MKNKTNLYQNKYVQSIRKPKLFWVSAGAPLVSVIISTVLSSVIKAQLHGISVVTLSLPTLLL